MDDSDRGPRDAEFSVFYARFHQPVVGFIAARLHNPAEAEDVAGEVFLAALRAYRVQRREIQFRPWIYEIARNACIDQHRKDCRRPPALRLEEQASTPAADDPHTCWERAGRFAALHRALRGLSALDRELIVLRELGGLSYAQLADHTGLTLPGVETALFRARRRLLTEFRLLTGERPVATPAVARVQPARRAA